MATSKIDSRTALVAQPGDAFSISEIAQAIVMPLASLRLTVALLSLAVLMTWVATLQQAYADVYNVKMEHFSHVLVEVPVQVFFPPAWAPKMQNVPGSLFLPSGISILVLMIINLTAAHSLRFKIQASGMRLSAGIIALVIAAIVTGVVIANGQRPGVQADVETHLGISYSQMWIFMQIALLAVGTGSIAWSFFTDAYGRLQRMLLLYLGAMGLLAAIILLTLNDKLYIGDSAMRIMWQLAQATFAAVVSYIACVFLFKRKAGMVLLHIGIMGLMLNEIWVTLAHKEHLLVVAEGQASSEVLDVRYHEMAIVDVSDPDVDRIITVPASKLARLGTISSEELPFDIRCVRYFRNSERGRSQDQVNPATVGIGLKFDLIEIPPVSGTAAAKEVDTPAAYVELFDKQNGDSLGIHAISSQLLTESADRVTVDGKDYHILLRVERVHKPYLITLNDAIREDYPGSDTPKYYGSEVTIDDSATGEVTEQRIFMNNPLRYGGETFYQSGMPDAGPGEPQLSIFQVVTNIGWMIPYVCCMFTVVGLLGQFMQSLLAYLSKQIQVAERKKIPVAQLADPSDQFENKNSKTIKNQLLEPQLIDEPKSNSRLLWLPALIMVGVLGIWAAMQFGKASKEVVHNGMRLDLLGQVPVTYEGRVQPLDSFARNTLRQLRERETVTDRKDKAQPAIAWLADGMFGVEDFDDYRTFYMTDPNVKNALDLPSPRTQSIKRKQYVYTVGEILSQTDKLNELIPDRSKVPEEKWTPLQRRLELLRRSTRQLKNAKFVFGPPEQKTLADFVEFLTGLRSATQVPFLVGSDDAEKSWTSMSEAMGPEWLRSIAGDLKTVDEVADKISRESWGEDELAKSGMIRTMSTADFQKRMMQTMPGTMRALSTPEGLEELLAAMPDAAKQTMIDRERNVRNLQLVPMLRRINDGNDEIASPGSVPENVALLLKLKPAYQSGDAKTFNQTLKTYLASVNQTPPVFYSPFKNWLEQIYNVANPLYSALVIYVAALVFVFLSWAGVVWHGYRVSVGRIAVALLILGLSFHAIGIVMRVAISGRPPVTNLYSSVVFVTAVGIMIALLMELFSRMSVGTMLGALSGAGGLLWAQSMTVVDGDTFTVMLAVLDTTFWLATHVIMISLGYAATFMAGLLGVAYLFGRTLTPAFSDKQNNRLFSNMIYGVVCFGLLASFFGTVLGGLWGDDSWGRFWGWDPKENGALMIVLWNALILHARWGGLVKERGVAGLAILGNLIVLWSWKGVNLLGVGLHAYAASEDSTIKWVLLVALVHVIVACFALLPTRARVFGGEA